ncbi:DNA-binding protein [Photobacterium damselae subsp. piscicida]|uniref:DNA-binding protein n=1 Tax=Photobacterium damselae TaxID=38293 RepID=UPI001FD7AC6C|nr:DNA-binding protein [Photobacterium damselae]
MARPKSYTNEDVIRAANQLIEQGVEPVGWRLRELIGRGRRETLDRDLRQLVEQGQITIEDKSSIESQQPAIQVEPTVILPLPVEIQEALKLIEGQLSSSLVNLVIQLNTLTDTHYEHLTRTRLLEG